MLIKNKWIRSSLHTLSGLMFAIGITKMENQISALMLITGGLVSLAALLSRVPDQEQEWITFWSPSPCSRLLILWCRDLMSPAPCASYANSFHSVVDQIKRFNGMALTYPGIEAERNRLRFYHQMNKKLVLLIPCLEDHDSEILKYYQEIKDMLDTQMSSFQ